MINKFIKGESFLFEVQCISLIIYLGNMSKKVELINLVSEKGTEVFLSSLCDKSIILLVTL